MSIEIKMHVESYDVQPNGNIKMSSLLKMMQKAAGDDVIIISHPRKTRGASFPRDFIIKVNDTIVAVARSMWVLLDLEKRTILRPSVLDEIGTLLVSDDDAFDLEDVRRNVDVNSLSRTDVCAVNYSQLDMNNHLNNTFYADFIFNCTEKILGCPLSNEGLYLQINYKNEARLNDTIEIFTFNDTDTNSIDFSANVGEKVCFSAYMSLGNN